VTGDVPLLEAVRVVRRAADGSPLLRGVSLAVRAGERVALAGPTGAGKSLLLRALALLDPIDEGEVRYRGEPTAALDVPTFRGRVSYLSQRPLIVAGSIEDNLRRPFSLRLHRGRAFDRGRAEGLFRQFRRGDGFLPKPDRDLSGGERQLVALVRVLLLEPSVLLLDEPTAALDPVTTGQVERAVRGWVDERPQARAFVWVSHDEGQVGRVAGRVVRLRDGEVVE
jgi:putative ABC transport system ATP-binding protein